MRTAERSARGLLSHLQEDYHEGRKRYYLEWHRLDESGGVAEVIKREVPAADVAKARALCEEWHLEGLSARERKDRDARRRAHDRRWALQGCLTEWLKGYAWEWFGHLTFKSCESLSYAKRAVGRFFHKLSRRAWGRNYHKRNDEGVFGFVAFERQKRGHWHAHFLVAGTRDLNRFEAMDAWSKQHGWARIHPYDGDQGGANYATKYATKDFDGDWEPIGRWRRIEELPLLTQSHGKA